MKFLRAHLFACIATLMAAVICVGIFVTDFNLFSFGLRELLLIEDNELEEFVTAFFLVTMGVIIDSNRARHVAIRQSKIDEQRLRVLKATMRTVHDLVNNFLNNLQLFRIQAEDGPLSPESLKLFDDLIYQTSDKLKALGDSESVIEYEMTTGPGIEPS